jgi:D-alanine transaminase/branched-chain amino acid aminotransferase
MFAIVNAEITPVEKAFLHISDLSIQRGYGIFDFFKIQDAHSFFQEDYFDRFYRSAQIMRLEVPLPRTELRSAIQELIRKNEMPASGIKMILTGGYSADGYHPATPNLIITQHALTLPGPEVMEHGINIITHEYVRDIPQVKTINYSVGIWLIEKIKQSNAADVLYRQNGVVSEFPRSNFFIVKHDNTVVTPALQILSGITRKNVLKLAAQRFKAEEGVVTMDDIFNAREAFLTSTTKRVVPIVQVDGKPIADGKPGPVTRALLEDLITLEKEDQKR